MIEGNKDYGWNDALDISLHDKVRNDMKASMRNKDNDVRDTMRLIISELPKLTVPITLESGKKSTRLKKPGEISNEDMQTIIRSLAKSEKIVLEAQTLETSAYLELLQSYLPKMIERDEIFAWIKGNIDFSEFKNSMQAVGPIMKHFGKLADGNMVQDILKEF